MIGGLAAGVASDRPKARRADGTTREPLALYYTITYNIRDNTIILHYTIRLYYTMI